MSEETRPRRSKPRETPEMPTGYRASRRGSKTAQKTKRAMKVAKVRNGVDGAVGRVTRLVRVVTYLLAWATVIVVGTGLLFVLVASGINSVARWQAVRDAEVESSPEAIEAKARDNILVIGVSEDRAEGFLAVRIEPDNEQVFGIAIPDAAFIEVPGQGFERIGDSFIAGPDVSLAAVSNFFGIQFTRYVTVDSSVYQGALQGQTLVGLMDVVLDTNLDSDQADDLKSRLDSISSAQVALVPLPVKPITLGAQTYFEPQRDDVSNLLETWWGVTLGGDADVVRVIVYNGSGVPGIAGEAAQLLIRNGYRVVDTKNADTFDYEQTQIVVQNGVEGVGEAVLDVLGTGEIVDQESGQQIADVIVILGSDFPVVTP